MHICFVLAPFEFYSPVSGGALATITAGMSREMVRQGVQVTVLGPANDDPRHSAGQFVAVQARQRHQLTLAQRLVSRAQLEIHQWDLSYYNYYLHSVRKALDRLSPPPDVIVMFNDLVMPRYLRTRFPGAVLVVDLQNEQGTRQRNVAAALRGVDLFVTCSRHIQDWTCRRYSLAADRFLVLHSGVDLDAFTPREGYLNPPDPARVLYIGRIDPNKGPDVVVKAVGQLRQQGCAVSMTVAGGVWFYPRPQDATDPFLGRLQGLMRDTGARYLGHITRPHVPELMRQHDIVCVLSRVNEPFGLVVLEAMAAGCAVVAADRGGLPEACGGAGVLVDPDDFEAVVGALRTLLQADALAEQKRRSVERAGQASWAAVTQRFMTRLGEVVGF